ncbi:hypothetical protein SDC9_106659 [bioreactor metagenome]|uniref:Uncharacterized protein n=1 Tax=bioreactor metagenome TaxID=1076179 RepID=A0A645B9K3_9ZZZZ
MFEFLRIQYKLGSIDEAYLDKMVTKGRITEEEKNLIINQ